MNEEILVVDDSQANRRFLEEILISDGFTVRTADNGEAALNAVAMRPPALILLDIIMSGMDGIEVCRRLKGDPKTSAIPVLFISGLTETEDKVSAFQAGGFDYICKPFNREEVLARVRTHLGLSDAHKQLARCYLELDREFKARKAVEERLRAIFDQCPDPICIMDPETMKLAYFNSATHERLGYTREEFEALSLLDFVEGVTPEKIADIERELGDKGCATLHLRDHTKTGEARDVLVSVRRMDLDGRTMAQFVVKDITDWMRLENALRESEQKYRALFEASKDAILVFDNNGVIIDVNNAGIDLFGYSKEELLSMNSDRLFPGPEARKGPWERLDESGFVNDYEIEMNRKGGGRIVVHLSLSVIRNDEGEKCGLRGIVRDLTERRKLEQQLLQAQKMESIALLAGGVAHDFNNLLAAISGYGQILRDGVPADDDLLKQSAAQLLLASERAADLTRSLLAFSRRQVINPKPVLLETVINNAGRLIKTVLGGDIEFSTQFCEKKLLVMVDEGQFHQILLNMATNARDAMPKGGQLHIATRDVLVRKGSEAKYDLAAPGRYALITVSDTGVGINEKNLGKVFDPFFTTKELGKGTGLGLAMIYGAVKQNNGSVLVKSEPGRGTTFNIYIPLIKDDHQGHQAAPSRVPKVSETILIVEDDELINLFLRKIFENAGYRVILATDGEEALKEFREKRDEISIILSDVIIPKKNGFEIVEEARRLKPSVKAVFISGYTADFLEGKGVLKGEVDMITKPFVREELLRKVRAVLDRT